MSIMDRSWYQELAIAKLEDGVSDEEYERRIHEVNTFERQLTDDGYLVISSSSISHVRSRKSVSSS